MTVHFLFEKGKQHERVVVAGWGVWTEICGSGAFNCGDWRFDTKNREIQGIEECVVWSSYCSWWGEEKYAIGDREKCDHEH